MNNKIAIYGTGSGALSIYESLNNEYEIVYFIDEFRTEDFCGLKVYKASELNLKQLEDTSFYIAMQENTNAIAARQRLKAHGISDDNLYYHDSQTLINFTLPYLLDANKEKINEAIDDYDIKYDLQGWFPLGNQKGLIKILEMGLKDDIKVLEIGSWKGLSSSIIAKVIKAKNGCLFSVDTFEGSEGVDFHKLESKKKDILHTYICNMKYFQLDEIAKPMKMYSFEAADILADDEFDIIFIDASHTYENVKNDIKSFLPKLKKGGIICGDDCEDYYKNLPSEIIEKHCNEEHTFPSSEDNIKRSFSGCYHFGVIKALYECFGESFTIEDNSSFWWKRIE